MFRRFMLVAMMLALPGIAHAQLGKMIKQKAAEKLAGKAADKAAEKAGVTQGKRTYHAERYTEATIGQELDQKTFEAVLRGMSAVQNDYASVQAERTRLTARMNELAPTAIPLDSAWRVRHASIEQCQRDYVDNLMEKRQADLQGRAMRPTDQKTLRLMMTLTDSGTQAAQRGDSVAVERYNRRLMKLTTGIDVAADSAAAAKKCGVLPARPEAALELARARAQIDSLMAKERAIQEQTLPNAARASGLPPLRFALARERILTWYADQSGEGDLSRWPRKEREMFERRRDEIRRALGYGT
ncbi:MAG TPA: hypothetical protein VFU01_02160 [Gemmatimonadaceae bacterium]|nr:hypothetical protein [Gemmatimonadaceae bacterium]